MSGFDARVAEERDEQLRLSERHVGGFYALGKVAVDRSSGPKSWSTGNTAPFKDGQKLKCTYVNENWTRVDSIHAFGFALIVRVVYGGQVFYPGKEHGSQDGPPVPFVLVDDARGSNAKLEVTLVGAWPATGNTST